MVQNFVQGYHLGHYMVAGGSTKYGGAQYRHSRAADKLQSGSEDEDCFGSPLTESAAATDEHPSVEHPSVRGVRPLLGVLLHSGKPLPGLSKLRMKSHET
eukprot:1724880-Rhodomonas_salina.2